MAVFPGGEEFVLKTVEYHDESKVEANKGAEGKLPANWLVENETERRERAERENNTLGELAR